MLFMETRETSPHLIKRPALTPKAFLHQKFGSKACYKIEEVHESFEDGCLGVVIPQQSRCLYRCILDLPEFSITSDTFTRKKDAEQSAAKLALEKLGIESTSNNLTPQEAWNEVVSRVSSFFTDEFLLSSHPLVGHFRAAIERKVDLSHLVPVSIIAACDMKLSNLCKSVNIKTESDILLLISLVMKAARLSASACISDGVLWLGKRESYSPKTIQSLIDRYSSPIEHKQIEALCIPYSIEKPIEMFAIGISSKQYYMDQIALRLGAKDSSQVLVSRTVGKASSEMRLYFSVPEIPLLLSDSSVEMLSNVSEKSNLKTIFNNRASYLSGQDVYGDAVLATIGYTWKSPDLFFEDVSLCTYCRMLIGRAPEGNYKLSREAILAAQLPTAFTTPSNWRGTSPKDLLCMFCRYHQLSEPIFSARCANSSESVSEILDTRKKLKVASGIIGGGADGQSSRSSTFRCEVKILSKGHEPMLEYTGDAYRKQADAIQNAALNVLSWLNKYIKNLNRPTEALSSFGLAHNIHVYPKIFSQQLSLCLFIHCCQQTSYLSKCSPLVSMCVDQPNMKQENGMILLSIEGPDSGVSPSPGSLACISYTVSLMRKGECVEEILERKEEFEFEIGTGAVINPLETCVTQMSTDQAARFIVELPSNDLIFAAAGKSAMRLSQLSLCDCYLEYLVQVLRVTEPLEDRIEQALFNPTLSKQRVEFAVGHINKSGASTLVDFGCGSGSLLHSLLEHTTSLEMIAGVDISRKSLTRAAKILHSKLSDPMGHTSIRSAVLYDGSITNFDSRLYGCDIGTCLEVIEHMEEDQACLFGDMVLGSFCPQILIVSTPNYEYNPILQRTSLSSREDDPEEKSQSAPCKFRNHDHKFEWTREQFVHWATNLASRYDYSVDFDGVGGSGEVEPGFASQIAVFRRKTAATCDNLAENCSENGEAFHPCEVIWEWPPTGLDLHSDK